MSGSVAQAWKKLGSKCCKYTFTACKISSINSELQWQKVTRSNFYTTWTCKLQDFMNSTQNNTKIF